MYEAKHYRSIWCWCPHASITIFKLTLFIYFWLCWVFVSVQGPSPAAASGGHSSSRCAGLPPSRPLLLRSTGSRRAGSAIAAHGPSCSAVCGIFPDQGTNPSSTTFNTSKRKTSQLSISTRMDKTVLHSHNGILYSNENKLKLHTKM